MAKPSDDFKKFYRALDQMGNQGTIKNAFMVHRAKTVVNQQSAMVAVAGQFKDNYIELMTQELELLQHQVQHDLQMAMLPIQREIGLNKIESMRPADAPKQISPYRKEISMDFQEEEDDLPLNRRPTQEEMETVVGMIADKYPDHSKDHMSRVNFESQVLTLLTTDDRFKWSRESAKKAYDLALGKVKKPSLF